MADTRNSIFSIGIVAHHRRYERADKLADYVGAEVLAVDHDGKVGAGRNHEICYEWLAETSTAPWCVLLEDDAAPVKDFRNQLNLVLRAAPTPVLSLFLGRSRLVGGDHHFLLGTELLHHLAVAVRTPLIPSLLAHIRSDRNYRDGLLPIHEAVGRFARSVGIRVGYAHPSIVDHESRLPPLVARQPPARPDRAGAFGTRPAWRQTAVLALSEPA